MFSKQAGPYTLLKRIAVGGMGEIFLAQAKEKSELSNEPAQVNASPVVLKRILPHLLTERQFIDRFVDEARLMTQLQHKNILPVYELRHDQWGLYMVMEYLESHDLRSINRRLKQAEERWPPLLAVWVIKELCEGLSYAHNKRDSEGQSLALIHRDVSPSNILIGLNGAIKIIDFGVARAQGLIHQSITGSLQGKLAYMSPEQARSEELDQRSDLYSVGLILYEMLAGVRPRDGKNEAEILHIAQEARDLYLEDVWPEGDLSLCELVNKSLKTDPYERFNDAQELVVALDTWLRQQEDIEQVHTAFMAWLNALEITPHSGQHLSLDAAMELQLLEAGSQQSRSHQQGSETVSLSEAQVDSLQAVNSIVSTQQVEQTLSGSGLLVSSEQKDFSFVLDHVIQDPELLQLIHQETHPKKTESPNELPSQNTLKPKLLKWGALGFLLLLLGIVYWTNTQQRTRFEIVFQQKLAGQLTQVDSRPNLHIDGQVWDPQFAYPKKQPLEFCIIDPQWSKSCQWLTLNDRAWNFDKDRLRPLPLVSIELKTLKSSKIPTLESKDLSKLESPSISSNTSPTVSTSIKQKTKTQVNQPKPKPKTKQTRVHHKPMQTKITLKGLSKRLKPIILCDHSKTLKYKWLDSHQLSLKYHKAQSCKLKLKGYEDLSFNLEKSRKAIVLEPKPIGYLSLRVYPPASQIYVDLKPVSNPIDEYKLSGAQHTVKMIYVSAAESGQAITQEKLWNFELKPDQKIRKFFDLSKN